MVKILGAGMLTASFFMGFSSCELINPSEDIPSYIKIDTFMVTVNDFDKGSSSHYMTDIWISVGGTNMGVYTMPFTIPTLETGLQTITISGGIKLNGISASRMRYPFYEPVIFDMELHAGEIHEITPKSTYKEVCKFPWIEDFEDPGISLVHPDYSDAHIENNNEVVYEGRYSANISLNEDFLDFEAHSDKDFELPENGSPVLFEFDYLNTNGFEVGMYLLENGIIEWYTLVYVKPSSKWKRFYVDLGTTATYHNEAELYRISIRAVYEPEVGETGEIYLDNLKLIHY